MSPKIQSASGFVKPDFQDIPVGNLLFDFDNPRLTMGKEPNSEPEMVQVLWDDMAVDEIVDSISANGFFREEPIIVIPKDPKKTDPQKDKFTVVEGNRRLAAVRLLIDEKLRKSVGAKGIPAPDQKLRRDLERIPAG